MISFKHVKREDIRARNDLIAEAEDQRVGDCHCEATQLSLCGNQRRQPEDPFKNPDVTIFRGRCTYVRGKLAINLPVLVRLALMWGDGTVRLVRSQSRGYFNTQA